MGEDTGRGQVVLCTLPSVRSFAGQPDTHQGVNSGSAALHLHGLLREGPRAPEPDAGPPSSVCRNLCAGAGVLSTENHGPWPGGFPQVFRGFWDG